MIFEKLIYSRLVKLYEMIKKKENKKYQIDSTNRNYPVHYDKYCSFILLVKFLLKPLILCMSSQ